jgi:hypothetical protein
MLVTVQFNCPVFYQTPAGSATPEVLPGDPELTWLPAKREDLRGSKSGQKLLRDRVERSFPEFIARAPAGVLARED